jgi:hypothetical protein
MVGGSRHQYRLEQAWLSFSEEISNFFGDATVIDIPYPAATASSGATNGVGRLCALQGAAT